MNENFILENILKAIDDVNNKNYSFLVPIPSLKKDVGFKQLTTFQQKHIIKAVMDANESDLQFIKSLHNILKENCVDSEINIDELTVYDKLLISLYIRAKSIGLDYTVNLEYNNSPMQYKIDLEELIEKMVKEEHPQIGTLSYQGYKIEVGVPTLATELKFETGISETSKLGSEAKDLTENQVRSYIGDVFISELSKYIRRLQIPIDDQFMLVNMNELSYNDIIAIVEKMPSAVLEGILSYIENANASIAKITTLQIPVGVSEETKQIEFQEATLEINSDFFILS